MPNFVVRNALFVLMVMLAGAAAQAQTHGNPSPYLYPLAQRATKPGGPALSLDLAASEFAHDSRGSGVLPVVTQTAPPGDFGGSVNPPYQTILPGAGTTYQINVFPIDGFSSDLSFSVDGLPKGAKATFSPSTVAGGSGSTILTISTASSTPTASYRVTITGTGGGRSHSNTVDLNVGPAGTDFADFGGTLTPAYQTVVPGGSTTYEITAFPLNGFDSDVSLSVTGRPDEAITTFSPKIIGGGSGSSTLTITAASSTATGTYHLTVTGKGGGRTHTNGMDLNVGPAGTDFTNFTGSVTPHSETVKQGGSTSFTVNIEPLDGTGCVYMQVYGLPAATNGHFDRTTPVCGSPVSSVFAITTSQQTPTGEYEINFQGTSSAGYVHTGSVMLTVAAP